MPICARSADSEGATAYPTLGDFVPSGETKEELGIQREAQRLLIVDWAPHADEGDKILFVCDCGELGADEKHVQLAADELDRWEWVAVGPVAGIRHSTARPSACPGASGTGQPGRSSTSNTASQR